MRHASASVMRNRNSRNAWPGVATLFAADTSDASMRDSSMSVLTNELGEMKFIFARPNASRVLMSVCAAMDASRRTNDLGGCSELALVALLLRGTAAAVGCDNGSGGNLFPPSRCTLAANGNGVLTDGSADQHAENMLCGEKSLCFGNSAR